MAGHFAAQVKAKKLVLTHFSQRYKGVNDNLAAQDADCNVKKLVKQAEKVFMTGSIVAAEDFLVIPITLTQVSKIKRLKEKEKNKVLLQSFYKQVKLLIILYGPYKKFLI